MDWDRVNVWTNTFYTLIHSLKISKDNSFGDISAVGSSILDADNWISTECSYGSVLLAHPFGGAKIRFRRNPNKHFEEITSQLIKMLIQDLTVILDEMMKESLEERGQEPPNYPQSKVEKLATYLDKQYIWASRGCLELIAARNVLAHSGGRWNEKSTKIVESFVTPVPKVGEKLVLGVPMLFRYRKAMRTFLNETQPSKT